ncbi:hypothetical protein GQ42DRAFT_46457 [Ramicandelaber brevisporus]|nr:hypothetical protein GQ42DRAFT_46457 [Ramicandelaber brevisporus]
MTLPQESTVQPMVEPGSLQDAKVNSISTTTAVTTTTAETTATSTVSTAALMPHQSSVIAAAPVVSHVASAVQTNQSTMQHQPMTAIVAPERQAQLCLVSRSVVRALWEVAMADPHYEFTGQLLGKILTPSQARPLIVSMRSEDGEPAFDTFVDVVYVNDFCVEPRSLVKIGTGSRDISAFNTDDSASKQSLKHTAGDNNEVVGWFRSDLAKSVALRASDFIRQKAEQGASSSRIGIVVMPPREIISTSIPAAHADLMRERHTCGPAGPSPLEATLFVYRIVFEPQYNDITGNAVVPLRIGVVNDCAGMNPNVLKSQLEIPRIIVKETDRIHKARMSQLNTNGSCDIQKLIAKSERDTAIGKVIQTTAASIKRAVDDDYEGLSKLKLAVRTKIASKLENVKQAVATRLLSSSSFSSSASENTTDINGTVPNAIAEAPAEQTATDDGPTSAENAAAEQTSPRKVSKSTPVKAARTRSRQTSDLHIETSYQESESQERPSEAKLAALDEIGSIIPDFLQYLLASYASIHTSEPNNVNVNESNSDDIDAQQLHSLDGSSTDKGRDSNNNNNNNAPLDISWTRRLTTLYWLISIPT